MPRPDIGTRQKLIDTATDLVWTSSYGAVSVDDICRTAKVNKGSFYHYFPSKQDLALAAMEQHFENDIEPDLARIFADGLTFCAQVDALADSVLRNERKHQEKYGLVCGCAFASLGSEMIGQADAAISTKVEEIFSRCRAYLRNAAAAAMESGEIPKGDPDALTAEAFDFLTGQKMMARVHNSVDGMERDLKSGLRRILCPENDTSLPLSKGRTAP